VAYTDTKDEKIIFPAAASAGGVFTGTGDIAWLPVGLVAFRIRRIAVLVTTALTVTSSIFSFDMQPTAGSAAGRVTAWAGTLTITTAAGLQGKGFVTPELNLELVPGARLVVNQTQASTAGQGSIIVYGDYRWDTVANFAALTQLAA
jgi:hypothetical protein